MDEDDVWQRDKGLWVRTAEQPTTSLSSTPLLSISPLISICSTVRYRSKSLTVCKERETKKGEYRELVWCVLHLLTSCSIFSRTLFFPRLGRHFYFVIFHFLGLQCSCSIWCLFTYNIPLHPLKYELLIFVYSLETLLWSPRSYIICKTLEKHNILVCSVSPWFHCYFPTSLVTFRLTSKSNWCLNLVDLGWEQT